MRELRNIDALRARVLVVADGEERVAPAERVHEERLSLPRRAEDADEIHRLLVSAGLRAPEKQRVRVHPQFSVAFHR